MVAPLDFSQRLPVMVGGREALLERARAIAPDNPITRAGSLDNMPDAELVEHARGLLVVAFRDIAREPIHREVERHLAAVREEHEMMEGPAPSDGDRAWWEDLRALWRQSLRGYVDQVVGTDRLESAINGSEDLDVGDLITADLVERAVHDTPGSVDKFLMAMSVTGEDVAALARHVRETHVGRGASATLTVPEGALAIDISSVGGYIDKTGYSPYGPGDTISITEVPGVAVVQDEPLVVTSEFVPAALVNALRDRAVDGAVPAGVVAAMEGLLCAADISDFEDAADLLGLRPGEQDELLRVAETIESPEEAAMLVQRAVVQAHRAMAPAMHQREKSGRGRPRRAPNPEPSALSAAARALVEVVLLRTSTTEQALAELLGMTRSELRKVRAGGPLGANLEPTPAQFNALAGVATGAAEALGGAAAALRDEYEARHGIAS